MLLRSRIVLLVTLLSLTFPAIRAVQPKAELRSMWISTVWQIDWPANAGTSTSIANKQKSQMSSMIKEMAAANYNAMYFQVRSYCDAIYESKYEPWSNFFTGSRGAKPTYDPLKFIVAECHSNNMECHAWVNPLRFSNGTKYSTPNDVAMRNNGWLMTYNGWTIMNPALPEVRQRIVDICRDIIENYDVDGIIFDDYFYPSHMPTNSSAADYKLWKQSGTPDFAEWRRGNINKMIQEVYDMIQQTKPYVKFGVSPRGIAATAQKVADKYGVPRCTSGYDSQYDEIFSDPLAWLKAGTLDYVSPQIYWARGFQSGDFSVLCPWWADVAKKFNRHFYTSHSLEYFKDHKKETRERDFAGMRAQVEMNREVSQNAAPGAVFFSFSCVKNTKENGKTFHEYLKSNVFSTKALTPAIDWKNAPAQGTVENLKVLRGQLSWDKVENVRYAVYVLPASSKFDASLLTADNLVAHLYNNRINLTSEQLNGVIAVTIVDRYGNEYEPVWYSKSSGVEDLSSDLTGVSVVDGCVHFSKLVDSVEVYDGIGRKLVQSENCKSVNLRNFSGLALIKVYSNGASKTLKTMIK